MSDRPIGEIPRLTGRAGDVSVAISPMPFRETEKGRRFAYPEFPPDFLEELYKKLSAPRRQGLFRSKLICPTCETGLDAIVVGRAAVAINATLKRIPSPMRVEVEMPGLVCPGCHQSLVRMDDRNVQSDLSDALIDAFNAGDIKPG